MVFYMAKEKYKNKNVILTGVEKVRIKDLMVMINEIFNINIIIYVNWVSNS